MKPILWSLFSLFLFPLSAPAQVEYQFEDAAGVQLLSDPESTDQVVTDATTIFRMTEVASGDPMSFNVYVQGATAGSVSPEYQLVDLGPINCPAVGSGCRLYSIGGLISQRYIYETSNTNVPVTIQAVIFYNNSLAETVNLTAASNIGGLSYVSADLKNTYNVDAPNVIYIRLKATTTSIGQAFDWPTLNSFALSLGLGRNSDVRQAVPDIPSTFSLSGSSSNRLQFTSSLISANKRVGGAANSLSALEVLNFEYFHKVTTVDVNMSTYTKVYTTSASLASGGIRTSQLVRNTSVPNTRANIIYPSRGLYRTYVRAVDYEGKKGTSRSVLQKVNTFLAPRNMSYTVDKVNRKIRVGFRAPLTYQDGTSILSTDFKGYLISLKNKATGAIVHSYKTNQNYDTGVTRYFTTPNNLTPGTYTVSTCGWSVTLFEGLCATSGDLVVP